MRLQSYITCVLCLLASLAFVDVCSAQGVDLPLGGGTTAGDNWSIGRGAVGDRVRDLQNQLRAVGFEIKEDGVFGPRTEAALREFQSRKNLPVDGLFGRDSRTALTNAVTEAAATPPAGSATTPPPAEPKTETVQVQETVAETVGLAGALAGDTVDPNVRTRTSERVVSVPGEPFVSPVAAVEALTGSGKTLKFGARGDEVTQLQQYLKDQGYDVEPNGVFLGRTRDAVQEFQRRNGLGPDGVVGRQTVDKINELAGKPSPDLTPPTTDFGVANKWLSHALSQLGTTEIRGTRNSNPEVDKFHQAVPTGAISDDIPWCSSFASWVMQQSGLPSADTRWAKDWNKYGTKLDKPIPGAIVVFNRRTADGRMAGHVGFYLGEENGQMLLLGGNQSFQNLDRNGEGVNIQRRGYGQVIGYRWPPGVPLPAGN